MFGCFLLKILKWRHSSLLVFLMSGSRWWRKYFILAKSLSTFSPVILRGLCYVVYCWEFYSYIFGMGFFGGMGLAHSIYIYIYIWIYIYLLFVLLRRFYDIYTYTEIMSVHFTHKIGIFKGCYLKIWLQKIKLYWNSHKNILRNHSV